MASGVSARQLTTSDKDEWERRGLSQIEWEMVLDSRMPMIKLDELQESGISISEYFRYPWLNYGITEKEWLKSRKSGLLESDISTVTAPVDRTDGKKIVSALLLPGYHQFKQKVYWKGAVMTTIAASAVLIMAGSSISNGKFTPSPLILLLPPMLWSSIDIGMQINREHNPNVQRFSKATPQDEDSRFRITLSIQTR
jgi:hypothetical protein